MPTANINRRSIRWADEHYEGFWARAERGDWEPGTFATLDRCLRPDVTVIDAGAHIGAVALYAATIAKRVICLEPDPVSVVKLRRNIAANPSLAERIEVIPRALRPTAGTVLLGSLAAGGDSMSSTVCRSPKTTWMVDTVTPEEMSAVVPDGPLFVKVDIEGGEYEVVPAGQPLWRRTDVTIFISTHPQILSASGRGATLRRQTREMFGALEGFHRTLIGTARLGSVGWVKDRARERWPTLAINAPRDWLFLRP